MVKSSFYWKFILVFSFIFSIHSMGFTKCIENSEKVGCESEKTFSVGNKTLGSYAKFGSERYLGLGVFDLDAGMKAGINIFGGDLSLFDIGIGFHSNCKKKQGPRFKVLFYDVLSKIQPVCSAIEIDRPFEENSVEEIIKNEGKVFDSQNKKLGLQNKNHRKQIKNLNTKIYGQKKGLERVFNSLMHQKKTKIRKNISYHKNKKNYFYRMAANTPWWNPRDWYYNAKFRYHNAKFRQYSSSLNNNKIAKEVKRSRSFKAVLGQKNHYIKLYDSKIGQINKIISKNNKSIALNNQDKANLYKLKSTFEDGDFKETMEVECIGAGTESHITNNIDEGYSFDPSKFGKKGEIEDWDFDKGGTSKGGAVKITASSVSYNYATPNLKLFGPTAYQLPWAWN